MIQVFFAKLRSSVGKQLIFHQRNSTIVKIPSVLLSPRDDFLPSRRGFSLAWKLAGGGKKIKENIIAPSSELPSDDNFSIF